MSNIEETITKTRLNKNGRSLPTDTSESTAEKIKKQLEDGEGCRVTGSILVYKVPGNIHISTHSFNKHISAALGGDMSKLDLSHQVNQFNFGLMDDMVNIEKKFKEGNLRPLDGMER